MRIIISNSSPDPIYEQISKQVADSILREELEPGAPLPSIRSLARDLQISVITTKRAYEELEREGYIETVPGKGSFVSGQNPELLRERRLKIMENYLIKVVEESRSLGISLPELQRMLTVLFEEV